LKLYCSGHLTRRSDFQNELAAALPALKFAAPFGAASMKIQGIE
jgi:hypothetical protein